MRHPLTVALTCWVQIHGTTKPLALQPLVPTSAFKASQAKHNNKISWHTAEEKLKWSLQWTAEGRAPRNKEHTTAHGTHANELMHDLETSHGTKWDACTPHNTMFFLTFVGT